MRGFLHIRRQQMNIIRRFERQQNQLPPPPVPPQPALPPPAPPQPVPQIENKEEDKHGSEVPCQPGIGRSKNRTTPGQILKRRLRKTLTSQGCLANGPNFIKELMEAIPNSHYVHRSIVNLDEVLEYGYAKQFTSVIIIKKGTMADELSVSLLPTGPMATFKLSEVVLRKDIPEHGNPISHNPAGGNPQVVMNNFDSNLEFLLHSILVSIFPKSMHFNSRKLVTFHNDNGRIFFRHHRYLLDKAEYEEADPPPEQQQGGDKSSGKRKSEHMPEHQLKKGELKKIRKASQVSCHMQECGPRFTLELDDVYRLCREGKFEWVRFSEEMR